MLGQILRNALEMSFQGLTGTGVALLLSGAAKCLSENEQNNHTAPTLRLSPSCATQMSFFNKLRETTTDPSVSGRDLFKLTCGKGGLSL